jgi:PAS domain S-box-containing protein
VAGLAAFALIAYVQWRAERSREAQISLASIRSDALALQTLPWDATDPGRRASTERALRSLEAKLGTELAQVNDAALGRDEGAYERALAQLLAAVIRRGPERGKVIDGVVVQPVYGRFAAALDRNARSYKTVAHQAVVVTLVASALAIVFAIAVFATLLLRSERLRRSQRLSEKQYRLLFEHNPHPMWVYDVETLAFLAVNEEAVAQYGYSESEFAAMTIADIRPPADVERLQRYADELGDGPTQSGHWRHIRKDGSQIEVEVSSHTIGFRGRKARVVLAHDVTAQAAATRAVRESERRYRDLFENAHDLIATVDLEHRLTSVNRAFASALGYAPGELIGRKLTEFVPPDEEAALDTAYEEKLSGRAEGSMYEHELVAKDGSLLTIEVATRLILDGDQPIGVQAICRDVTSRRRAEAELRESRELYRLVVENAKDMITLIKPDGEIVYASPSHAEVLGHTPDALVGRNVAEFLHPDDLEHMVSVLRETLEGDTRDAITRLRRTDGAYVTVEGAGSRILDAAGTPQMVLSSSRDVSERIRARELEERLAQAQRLEAIGRLAGGIAHDFNNLLTAMNGYGDLALAHLADPAADPELRECVREMRSAGAKATQLTGQLLAFNRKQMLDARILAVNEVVREYEPMLTRLLGDDMEVRLELTDEPTSVLVDEGQLGQVIVNLAVNARDTMPDGGTVTITTEAQELSADEVPYGLEAGPFVRLAVKDRGAGIPAEVRDKIFDPFFTTKDRGEGTGLGLATVLGIVQQSGGQVTVDSKPGRGSTFNVYLPRIAAEVPPIEDAVVEDGAAPTATGRELVLLVEDNEVVRRLARSVLADAGYDVVAAETPQRALEIAAAAGPIDLVVTDVVMPGMNGRDLADELRRQQPDLRILFTSGFTDDVVLSPGTLQDGTSFLQKPFGVDELQRKVRELLESPPYAA